MTEKTLRVPPYYVTAKRARELFGVGRDMLEAFVEEGRLKKYKLGRRKVLYNGRQLAAIIEEAEW